MSFVVAFAAIIAFGVVYSSARTSLAERNRELAAAQVIGFTRAEDFVIDFGWLVPAHEEPPDPRLLDPRRPNHQNSRGGDTRSSGG